ncbi:MAG: NYN domain-containing protein [Leptospiraceae bacterium]|nr:NYN domain-containing protein [Leptospiraceae bacterium]MCP5498921.1 NYN domain-containing protein [Leptospiraceae bacterium]
MILVVDGFNLIYKFPELEMRMYENKLSEARLGLLHLLDAYKKKRKKTKIHAFFDGKKELGSEVRQDEFMGISIYYSHDLKADVLIKEFVKSSISPASLYVVSSDKDIMHHCKKYSANVQSSEDFAKQLSIQLEGKETIIEKEVDVKMSQEELLYWQSLFMSRKGK